MKVYLLLQSSVHDAEEGNYRDERDEEGSLERNESSIPLPRPPMTPNVPIRDPTICPVCKQPARKGDKHRLHYGGICCYSCRAFFRRAHEKTKIPHYTCIKLGDRRNITPRGNSSTTSVENENEGGTLVPNFSCCDNVDVKARTQCKACRYKRCIDIGKL